MQISNSGRYATIIFAVMIVLSSCTGRTILHGTQSPKVPRAERSNKITVWFVKATNKGDPKLVSVSRTARSADKLESAVEELLEGPTAREENAGLGTEIPRGTILIDLKHNAKNVELNLSRRFASGGGTDSFETRLEQLRRTVASAADAPVYLNVEGKRLNVSEGEGIEIKQPINR